MIPYEDAVQKIRECTRPLDSEQIDFRASLNRVLRQDVCCDADIPPFDRSAMDGYACRLADLESELEIIEIIPAGSAPSKTLGPNRCSKVMTGAVVPPGADCVIIVEEVETVGDNRIRFLGKPERSNITPKGSEAHAGQRLIAAGTRIGPKEIAVLAATGCVHPRVSRRPRLGIIATGEEIVEPDRTPNPTQIRNSNSAQLFAQSLQFGCEAFYYGIVGDSAEAITNVIIRASKESDLVLLTGGVSAGDFDFVPALLGDAGFETVFRKVAVQPGKPTVFACSGDRYLFALPGNPVSAYTIFEVLVKELLGGMMGLTKYANLLVCPLARAVTGGNNIRRAWIPVRITATGQAEPVKYHGSAHITALVEADGFISIPAGAQEIPALTPVEVRLI